MIDWDFFFNSGILIILNTFSFVTAMLAALFWYRSAKVEVPYDGNRIDADGMFEGGVIIQHEDGLQIDPFRTAARANVMNARAACFAALAAGSQAAAYFFPVRATIYAGASELWSDFLSLIPFL
ncbi:hypothetical protein [Rhizobium rhizogenes]|uniref:hypothetical protein n=1 Tax=Rhizobium rhizogenes TaxID=359 RepID=UPI00080FAA0E|nr:hypothetical protein [Rhizobium rhizogenes]OCJ22345.1 hypothetical protein A6U88_29470 [Agrobacterium sp. B131/95]NTH46635.1 hypothetical protein [Rhizobium rhizogenes]NTH59501.1 hypothetical protein [Rhizobium rhizogenes]NTH90652.1 hypothetical protein [Rhizobium rhizogenes]NTI42828.1 hypothetical protein [Rhizobium rhizogenes]